MSRFIFAVCEDDQVSGMAYFGTMPYFSTSATNMFHCPPSSAG